MLNSSCVGFLFIVCLLNNLESKCILGPLTVCAVGHKISRGRSPELHTTDLQQTQVRHQESNQPQVNDMKLMIQCCEPFVCTKTAAIC